MATGHLLGQLLPLQSVQLGRLVLNATRPGQDYIDPTDGPLVGKKFSQNSQTNYKETRRFSKSSKVKSYLSEIISFSYTRQNDCVATLSAPQATTYDLENSVAWFEDACGQIEVRKFLDRAIDDNRRVYLVVGFRTVSDGSLVKDFAVTKTKGASCQTPTHVASMRMPSSVGSMGLVTTSDREHGNGQELTYEAPGEQVFAVLYRKVKFKFLTRKAVGNMVLEANNRWESVWNWRGPNNPADEGHIIEVTLADLDDLDIEEEDDDEDDDEEDEGNEEEDEDEEEDKEEGGGEETAAVPKATAKRGNKSSSTRLSRELPPPNTVEVPRGFRVKLWYFLLVLAFLFAGLAIFWGGHL
ncbi:hypothetical protein Q9L58_010379 [Maublancomyces gigas]|uniref:Uncharacterized protein n=1 Tax=Discina gigas TaxID=1032678 RepID=A0ABR3G4N2_9PEZI